MTAFQSLAENLVSSTLREFPDVWIVPDFIEEAALMFMLRTTSESLSTNLELYDTICDVWLTGWTERFCTESRTS